MRRSKVLENLRAGHPALTVNISLSTNPLAVEIAGRAGIDGVWIDSEHRPFHQGEIASMITAGRVADVDCYIRIRKGEGYTSFFRPLEDGAAGIMVPHVTTREEAEWVARNAKFPPLGRRGMETMMPDADLGFVDPLEYVEHRNRETFVVIQIEDIEALDALDGIAAVDGVDILLIGPADLTFSMGIPLQFDHPRFRYVVSRIAGAAANHGKWWGMPVPDVAAAERYAEQGARFFNIGGDYGVLRNAFTAVRNEFNEAFGLGGSAGDGADTAPGVSVDA